MSRVRAAVLAAATVLALSGCGQKATTQNESAEKPAVPTINNSMRQVMEPKAETIWNTVSQAYNDVGDALVGSKLSDADWAKIGDSARAMKERAQILVDNADHLTVAAANEPILGSQAVGVKGDIGQKWDAKSAEQIHALIAANPKGFAEKAKILVDTADAMERAASTRDAVLLYKHASELDEVCDGCHEPFWGTDEPPAFPHDKK
jgi:hypothetical protein